MNVSYASLHSMAFIYSQYSSKRRKLQFTNPLSYIPLNNNSIPLNFKYCNINNTPFYEYKSQDEIILQLQTENKEVIIDQTSNNKVRVCLDYKAFNSSIAIYTEVMCNGLTLIGSEAIRNKGNIANYRLFLQYTILKAPVYLNTFAYGVEQVEKIEFPYWLNANKEEDVLMVFNDRNFKLVRIGFVLDDYLRNFKLYDMEK